MNNDKRNYPTRMHEVLGVEPHEPFEVKGHDGKFILDSSGAVRFGKHFEHSAYSEFVAEIINHPERIIRRPRLTDEQVKRLRALIALEVVHTGKPYQEIKAIINELTAQKYISDVTVCVRANNMGLKRPHRAWSKTDKRTINGNSVTLSEYSSFIGHRFHRLAPELQGIALLVAKLQVGLNAVVETKSEE